MADTKISDLNALTAVAEADEFVVVDDSAGETKKITAANLRTEMGRWFLIPTTKYKATPDSTSKILMSDTSDMAVGLPVKHASTANGTRYAIITAISSNVSITIAGAPLATGGGANDITALHVGTAEMVVKLRYSLDGDVDAGTTTTFLATNGEADRWRHGAGYVVAIQAWSRLADTGDPTTEIVLTPYLGGEAVSTENTNTGVALSGTNATWVTGSAVAIDATKYDLAFDDVIEIQMTTATGSTPANDVTDVVVLLTCVLA